MSYVDVSGNGAMIHPSQQNRRRKMQTNQQVRGTYLDNIQFRGVITGMRPLTVNTDGCFEYMIDLDEPVTVFGETRTKLVVYAKFDGSPSTYSRMTDSISGA